MKSVNYFLVLLLLLISCKKKEVKTDYLGTVNLRVSGSAKALPHFEKGLLLLHSFEYEDAREAFLEGQKADPKMGMAYWGEAMTYNHCLWRDQDYEKSKETLERLKNIPGYKAETELEKDLIKSLDILYKAKTPKNERDKLYSQYMDALYKKYPNNHEVAAFYALSLLGSVSEGRDDKIYGQGAIIAKSILEENPNHPGALHYLIHSYDDPNHAQLALNAADSYSQVAPDASHALHMPSHIYVALGMWDEVVSSNEHSYQASIDRMMRKNLDNDARGYHAFHWLEYGYLQQNRIEDAKKLVLEMEKYTNENPSKRARMHLVFLKGTFLAETNDWDSNIKDIPIDISDLNIGIKSQYYFIEGMKAFKSKNERQLQEVIEQMTDDIEKQSLLVSNLAAGFSVCSNSSYKNPTQSDINKSQVILTQVLALQSWLKKDSIKTEALLKESVALENNLIYSYGPPSIQIPTYELYAEWLLENNRPKEAIEAFNHALKRGPKRRKAIEGINNSNELLVKV